MLGLYWVDSLCDALGLLLPLEVGRRDPAEQRSSRDLAQVTAAPKCIDQLAPDSCPLALM